MSIDEETDIIEAIVKSHKSGKVAFHVAYDQLIKEHGLTEEQAYELLFPPLDDDFDMNVNTVSTGFTVDGLTFDNEEELRKKYPALQDAWDHYKNVKHMCEQKEKENEN